MISVEELARKGARVKKGEKPEVITRILLSLRADDMALRLKYAGFPAERIELVRDYEKLLGEIAADAAPAFIMPTYTAMFDLRGEIGRHTDVKAFYE